MKELKALVQMEGMEPTSELAGVKKELALVRLQLDELLQFLKVEEHENVAGTGSRVCGGNERVR